MSKATYLPSLFMSNLLAESRMGNRDWELNYISVSTENLDKSFNLLETLFAHVENEEIELAALKIPFLLKKEQKDSNCYLLKCKGKSIFDNLEVGSPRQGLPRNTPISCFQACSPLPFNQFTPQPASLQALWAAAGKGKQIGPLVNAVKEQAL